MDQTHIHLLINHLPVMGALMGMLVLVYALITGSAQTRNAAFLVFMVCALGAGITYLTGEGAEETVEHLPGISEAMIEEHEDAGKFALIGMIVLGVSAAVGFFVPSIRNKPGNGYAVVVLLIALAAFGVTAYAANLGGKIRHTELSGNAGAQSTVPAGTENEEHQ